MPKKILLYTDTPIVGGAELQMFLLAKFLNKEKFEPILACSNFQQLNKWCQKFEKEKIQVRRLEVKNKHDPRHYFQLRKVIKEEKINLVHNHIWNPASCRYGYFANHNLGVPLVITEHDPFPLRGPKNWFKRLGLNRAQKMIAVSEDNAQILRKHYPKQQNKITVIHNGIDTDWWQSQLIAFNENERRKIKENLFSAHENSLVVISVAALHERKGLDRLIMAMAAVVKEFPNVKCVIAGEGPARTELEKLIRGLKLENNLKLLGQQKQIPFLMASSDIFVLPSRREAFGFAALEAMISGLPVIASEIGGLPEVLGENTGILVDHQRPGELAAELKKLISNEKFRVNLAKTGRKRALEEFSAKVMTEKYEAVYSEVLS